uniref:D-2-hydroxyglutarate dehydrogenase, mitochondrial n=1 Tax=Ditylenchus dipsaci TaxID=166011 RepID=A0A915CNK7_9BILA
MLNEILSSFELMDFATMDCIEENAGLKSVLVGDKPAFNLLVETSGSNTQHDAEKMEKFLEYCLENDLAADGILANSVADANYLWKLRENASVALNKDGYVYKHDFSLPLTHFYTLAEVVRQRLGDKATRVVAFGMLEMAIFT